MERETAPRRRKKTNVWRLFQAIDQRESSLLAMYDDGVGTSSNKYLSALGGAFGFGLKRNVMSISTSLSARIRMKATRSMALVSAVALSRFAFWSDLIAREGLVPFCTEEELDPPRSALSRLSFQAFPILESHRHRIALAARRHFARQELDQGEPTYAQVSAQTKAQGRDAVRSDFLGLWDTVEAYGIPIAELKRGIDWVLWPMLFGEYTLSKMVDRACHALSLDDARTTFHPLLWDEAAEAKMVEQKEVPPGRITQVWFAGVHCNVGGGYPEDRLSLVPLEWIMGEAKASGMPLDDAHIQSVAADCSPYARLYDSRAGLAYYFPYEPRSMPKYDDHPDILPMVHGSVIMRMGRGSDQYAPIILPHQFWVVAPDGELLPMTAPDDTLSLDDTKKKMAMAAPATKSKEDVADEKAELKAVMAGDLARPNREAIRTRLGYGVVAPAMLRADIDADGGRGGLPLHRRVFIDKVRRTHRSYSDRRWRSCPASHKIRRSGRRRHRGIHQPGGRCRKRLLFRPMPRLGQRHSSNIRSSSARS